MLTPEEEARLDEATYQVTGRRPRRDYPRPPDYRSAMRDYVLMSRSHVANAEPLAREWRRDGLSLSAIRERAGMTTADFGNALQSGTGELLQSRFADLSADIATITANVPLDNFKAKNFTALSLGVPPKMVEDEEPRRLPAGITQSVTKGALLSFGGAISFNYSVWMNHGDDLLSQLENTAGLFSLLEVSQLVSTIEGANIPTSATTAMDLPGLNKANQALRAQANTAGQVANLGIHALIVPASLEFSAHTVLQSAGLSEKIRVVVLPFSSATSFYCVADPMISAPLLRLSLRGSKGPKLELNARRSIGEGVEFFIVSDFNFYHAANQPGVLKCTA